MQTTLPAEWAPQSAVMLTWPQSDGDFARWFARVEDNFARIVRTISQYQDVIIGYGDDCAQLRARLVEFGAVDARLKIFPVTANDVWARDHGPITVLRDGALTHLDFRFNGWGGKFEAALDDQVTRALAGQGAFTAPVETLDFVLEGGGIESDGLGTLLTTRRCLLKKTRNPGMIQAQVEQKLKDWFGLNRVLWLHHGDLIGDDTDGHIDTLARFCDAQTIAYQACDYEGDPHFEPLRKMQDELRKLRTAAGAPYQLVPLPLPSEILDEDYNRLPAGYANFLIINGAVLVPVYGDPVNDPEALHRLRQCFPDREVISIDCRALIHQYGSLHCVTMQIPKSETPPPLAGEG